MSILPCSGMIGAALEGLRKDFSKPSDYSRDPVGWLGNQSGHWLLGSQYITLVCVVSFIGFGEFPDRFLVVLSWFIIYFVFWELFRQGWRGWDTIEDTIFSVFYGAAGLIYAFKEVVPGSLYLAIDPYWLAFVLLIRAIHLFLGATWRSIKKRKFENRV